MKSKNIDESLKDKFLADLPAMWEQTAPHNHTSQFSYTRQHAARARKWITAAVCYGDSPVEPSETELDAAAEKVPLLKLLSLIADKTSAEARSLYLTWRHGIPANDSAKLPTKTRKNANNISESVTRALRFAEEAFGSTYGTIPGSSWPEALSDSHYAHAMILYRCIQRKHVRAGVIDPVHASAKLAAEAAKKYVHRAESRRDAGPFNTMRRRLLEALEKGLLMPLNPALLTDINELRFNSAAAPDSADEAVLLQHWPEHFFPHPDCAFKIDRTRGLCGFFNKQFTHINANPKGEKCAKGNIIGEKSVEKRLQAIRRMINRALRSDNDQPGVLLLEEYFTSERLISWLDAFLDEPEDHMITAYHRGEFWHMRYTAKVYFGACVDALDVHVEESIDFPESGASMRGTYAVQLAGSPIVFLEWAAAFRMYAAQSSWLDAEQGTGFYLPRKSCELDVLIRAETGLRPGNVEQLNYLRSIPTHPDKLPLPAIYRLKNGNYVVCIPFGMMKQHKKKAKRKTRHTTARRPYEFLLELPETVHALDEYIEHGWQHADGVRHGKTQRLFLGRTGHPIRCMRTKFAEARAKASGVYQAQFGKLLPLLDRYSTRHVISEFLHRHQQGSSLKQWYLTHRSGVGSDNSYGSDDAAFLRKCVHEVLRGVPPLHDQVANRQDEQDKLRLELHNQLAEVLALQKSSQQREAEMREEIKQLRQQKQQLMGKLGERTMRSTDSHQAA
ncbi:MAG: hypothetical protein ACR2IE_16755 [Candidatus Sumerlaeaceae bacterium]